MTKRHKVCGMPRWCLYDDAQKKLRETALTDIEHKLLFVLKDGPLTRDQIIKKLDVPRTTAYDGLHKLIIRNEVKKYPIFSTERSRGRPYVLFSLLERT